MDKKRLVYVVDSDETLGTSLKSLLARYGIEVRMHANAESFLAAFRSDDLMHCCLLLEMNPGKANGLSLLRQIRESVADIPVIALTDSSNREDRRRALQAGVTEIIEKPVVNAYLAERLSHLLLATGDSGGLIDTSINLANGKTITIRAMRPEDAEIEQAFVRSLSLRTKYLRFFSGIKQLSPRMLYQLTHTEYPESYAVIATVQDEGQERQIGVARYAPTGQADVAEFAVVIADEWHGQGIARHILGAVTIAAAIAGIKRLEGLVLKENQEMLGLARSLGFKVTDEGDMSAVRVVKELRRSDIQPAASDVQEVDEG